jgi:hypothetical protein
MMVLLNGKKFAFQGVRVSGPVIHHESPATVTLESFAGCPLANAGLIASNG